MNDAVPRRAYIDANVFVEMFEKNSDVATQIRKLFIDVQSSALVRLTSELTLAELLVKPMKERNTRLVQLYSGFVQTGPLIDVAPIDRQVLYTAAMTRAEDGGTKLPDAIHIATALDRECDWFITGDRALRLSARVQRPFKILNPFSPEFAQFVGQLSA